MVNSDLYVALMGDEYWSVWDQSQGRSPFELWVAMVKAWIYLYTIYPYANKELLWG
jgi:hypothetical protein